MESPFASVPHPRLFVPKAGFDALKNQVRTDPPSRRIAECLRRKAEQFCALPPNGRVMEGRRLLAVSRSCLERILTLAMVGRLDGEERFVRRAIDEMLAAAAFTDWNPSHFLDVAEMTFALGVGYDWLYDLLSGEERDTVAAAIVEKGLKPSFVEPVQGWVTGTSNWNQVCHAGLAIGALALAAHEPALVEQVITRAVANVPRTNVAYAPDGAYAEGAMYWGYGTSFHVALITALESATGSDHGLADGPGFLASAHYMRQVAGPSGKYFNYSDSREGSGFQLPILWFARRLHEPALAGAELRDLDRILLSYERMDASEHNRLLALGLTWHRPSGEKDSDRQNTGLPLHWRGLGETPVAMHRSAWNDPQATFVGIKGGSPSVSHAHMDVGGFVLDAGGVRWASDLGMQEYFSLERLGIPMWDGKQGGGRWTVFRLGHEGHNVPSFNGAQPLVTGDAPIVRHATGGQGAMAHTVVDLSTVYADRVLRMWRGVGLLADGRVVLQDEWTAGTMSVDVRWQMLTFAQVALDEAGSRFLLSHEGKRLELRLDPVPGMEVKMSVEEKSSPVNSYDVANPGLSLLVLRVRTEPGQTGSLRLVAALEAVAGGTFPPWQPLADWSAGG